MQHLRLPERDGDDGTRARIAELRATLRALAEDSSVLPILRTIADMVRAATDAIAVHIERTSGVESELVVVSADVDSSAETLNRVIESASRIVIALGRRNERIGTMVLFRGERASAVDTETLERISDLATMATLALARSAMLGELEHTKEECRRIVDDKYRLISGISDELKDRLGTAMEYVALLELEGELSERQRHYMQRSRSSIDGVIRIINDLVQLSRVDTGRVSPRPEPANLTAVVRGLVRDYQLALGTIGFEFDIGVPDDLPVIMTDIDLVRQVLDTLLSNAVRYTPVGGRVTVRGDVRPGRRKADPNRYVCLAVSDTGPGVGENDLIFEEVYRVERRGEKPGFRLAISRRIARLLGGELTLETEAGRGSTFTLWLPDAPPTTPRSYTDLKQQTDTAMLG
jgi:signal transduction histidine kinase